jgi:hypothetical protein
MTQREYLKSLNSPEQQKNIDDVPTRLQRKETTVEVRMAKGGKLVTNTVVQLDVLSKGLVQY